MLSMLWKIGGDISPMRQALNQVAKEAEAAGKKAGAALDSGIAKGSAGLNVTNDKLFKKITSTAKLQRTIAKTVGVSAMISGVGRAFEHGTELYEGAEKERVDTDTFQIMEKAAKAAGLEMDQLREKIKQLPQEYIAAAKAIDASGGLLSKQSIDELRQGDAEIKSLKQSGTGLVAFIWKWAKQIANTTVAGSASAGASIIEPFKRVASAVGAKGLAGSMQNEQDLRTYFANEMWNDVKRVYAGQSSAPSGPMDVWKNAVMRQEQFDTEWKNMGGDLDWSKSADRNRERADRADVRETNQLLRENNQALRELHTLMRNN